MMIQVHGVDGHGILRSLRGVTLSPELTSALLAAVMDQLASASSPQPIIDRWQQLDPQLLLRMTRMTKCGR
jgi:predicted anti-sigma-YlaC factor YlaD